MTPRMMVLGLACEEPGTVADIQRRLSDLFTAAAFPKNSAHTSLPRLAKDGYVRLLDDGTERFEGTQEGIGYLREWVTRSPPAPAIREAIHGKIEFAGTLDELLEIMIFVRAEAKALQICSDDAHHRMLAEQRRRLRGRPKHWAEEMDAELTAAHLLDAKMTWEDAAARRRKLGDRLEMIYRRYAGRAR